MSNTAWQVVEVVVMLLLPLLMAGGLVLVERRLLGQLQDRYGPNRVGIFGEMQVLADAVKLLAKEDWIPPFADRPVFVAAPAIILVVGAGQLRGDPARAGVRGRRPQRGAAVLPGHVVARGVQRGAGRLVVAQQVLAARRPAGRRADARVRGLHGAVPAGRGHDGRVVQSQRHRRGAAGPVVRGAAVRRASCCFFVAGLAETRRIPFDLPEAESELVAGYHTEYSGMKFGIFYVGEYLGITLISAFDDRALLRRLAGAHPAGLRCGSCSRPPSSSSLFIVIRAALPRLRYDQLMALGWKVMLPLALLNLMVTAAVVLATDGSAGP